MPKGTMRTHIVVPEDLVQQVDRVAGKRRRSRFVEEAIREKLSRQALGAALATTAGVLDAAEYPEWARPEAVSGWVRERRQEDDARLARKLRASND
jgi:metal-responsive CopG/Arc/MetJ family transcriptional regulator